MTEPADIEWGSANTGDSAYFATPGTSYIEQGWAAGTKPPNQYANYLQKNARDWQQYLLSRGKSNEQTLLSSSGTATWNGSDLVLSANLDFSFRKNTGKQVNRIAAGTLIFTDGDVLVLRRDESSASPVTLSLATAYADLAAGQYYILAESSLTATNMEYQTVIFRRNGTDLECPLLGVIFSTGDTITFGKAPGYAGSTGTGLFVKQTSPTIATPTFTGNCIFDTDTFFVDAANNRIGVGIVTPEVRHHIYNGAGGGSSADANTYLKIENNGHAFIEFETGATHESGLIFSDGTSLRGGVTYDHNADRILFRAAGVQDNVISSTGLGLGTTPGCKLHIYESAGGGAAINANTQLKIERNGTSWIEFENTSGDTAGILFSDSVGAVGQFLYRHTNDSFGWVVAGTEKMTLNSSGELLLADQDPPTANCLNQNSGVKGRAQVTDAGASNGDYNVSSTSTSATGTYSITWDTDFSDTTYSVAVSARSSSSNASARTSANHASGSVTVFTTNILTAALTDYAFDVIATGDQ